MISEHISDDIPPKMKILNMVIPILMHNQIFPLKKTMKMYFVAPICPAAASCIKPLASCIYSHVSQCKATLCNDVGFLTVSIYRLKFMTLSNQTSRCICIRIVVYRFSGNVMTSITTLCYDVYFNIA